MLKKDNLYRVLEVFFDNPISEGMGFQLREISRQIGLAPKSVRSYLEELEKEDLITRKPHRIHNYPVYYANRDNGYFRFLKGLDVIRKLKESGLVDYVADECMPDVIILFGSASRGEDTAESDLDLYLQCKEKKLNLARYEKMMKRKIGLFFNPDFNKLSEELKSNIINGHVLKGYLRCRF